MGCLLQSPVHKIVHSCSDMSLKLLQLGASLRFLESYFDSTTAGDPILFFLSDPTLFICKLFKIIPCALPVRIRNREGNR